MAGNRYYSKTTQEVLVSYEWLMKEQLTKLDGLARNMMADLAQVQIYNKEAQGIVHRFFTELWEQVAETEAIKALKGERERGEVDITRRGAEC